MSEARTHSSSLPVTQKGKCRSRPRHRQQRHGGKIVQSKEVVEEAVVEDPLCHLLSDTDSELEEDIK